MTRLNIAKRFLYRHILFIVIGCVLQYKHEFYVVILHNYTSARSFCKRSARITVYIERSFIFDALAVGAHLTDKT